MKAKGGNAPCPKCGKIHSAEDGRGSGAASGKAPPSADGEPALAAGPMEEEEGDDRGASEPEIA